MKNNFTDANLIDMIKDGFDFKYDSQVAAYLDINKTSIHNIRQGNRKLGIMQRLKLLDKIAFIKTINLIEDILPEKLSKKIRSTTTRLAHKKIKDNPTPDAELLILFKEAYSFSTDADLAEFLGLASNTVSMIRTGKTSLGPIPRLKILDKLSSEIDFDSIDKTINSNELLLIVLKEYFDKKNGKDK
ncbi:MAG: hypothetical protein QM484_09515 [Woeseiaceae bacterium]